MSSVPPPWWDPNEGYYDPYADPLLFEGFEQMWNEETRQAAASTTPQVPREADSDQESVSREFMY